MGSLRKPKGGVANDHFQKVLPLFDTDFKHIDNTDTGIQKYGNTVTATNTNTSVLVTLVTDLLYLYY